MDLLEREPQLAALAEYAAEARGGSGRLVLVTGEAGIGKTSLVDAFRATLPDTRWLWAACDGGFTPRPLAPLHEIAAEVGGRLRELCAAHADRNELFTAFLSVLGSAAGPVGVVIEDLHWADEATLDWLSHLKPPAEPGLPALVLATYRDDEPRDDGLLADRDGTARLSRLHAASPCAAPDPRRCRATRRQNDGPDPRPDRRQPVLRR